MRNYEGTLRLQGIGMVEGIKVKNIKVGDILVWNYGGTEKVLTIEFTKTGKSLKLTVLADDQKTYERTLRVERIVAVKELNSEIIETEEISQELIVNKEIENTLSNNMEVEEMKKESKVLYFEGAGWEDADTSIKSGVGNCRIRTAFTNNEGKQIYLEICGTEVTKHTKHLYSFDTYVGFVDSCHYITDGKDDENQNSIYTRNYKKFEYTKENILSFINNELNCNFDSIEVLNNLTGYRVFGDKEKYNFGDKFEYDPILTGTRKEVKEYFYNIEKSEGKKYPNFSIWVDEENKYLLHLLRHFNGYNKHWLINIESENWKDTIKETILGKYAC